MVKNNPSSNLRTNFYGNASLWLPYDSMEVDGNVKPYIKYIITRNDTLLLLDVQETALVNMLYVKDRHLLFYENLL